VDAGEAPVAYRGDELADVDRCGEGSLEVRSVGSITSCNGGEARLESARAPLYFR
jgi:hypothetical protein